MKQYLDLLKDILDNGEIKGDRTGTGTKSVFGRQMRFNLQEGFPLLTTKKLHTRSIFVELLWFLRGDTNIKYLHDHNVKIWDQWADANGDLGPVYGKQWRSWPGKLTLRRTDQVDPLMALSVGMLKDEDNLGVVAIQQTIDQISNVVHQLKTNPNSRRLIVSAWNPAEVDSMALPPCHCLFQFYTRPLTLSQRIDWFIADVEYFMKHSNPELREVAEQRFRAYNELPKPDNSERLDLWVDAVHTQLDSQCVPRLYLDCQLYQRSCDAPIGQPFNIASYALLVHLMAQQTNMLAGDFVWTGGDTHIYLNQLEGVAEQLSREPRGLPQLRIKRKPESIFDYTIDDFEIEGYDPHPHIPMPVSV